MTIQAWVDGSRVRLRFPFDHHTKDQVKALPGARWDPKTKTWHIGATAESAAALMEAFPAHGFLQGTPEFWGLAAAALDAADARKARDAEDLEPIPGEKRTSWLHQLQAWHFAKGQDAAMLMVGMGGGKTKIAIDLFEEGWPDVARVLIACPSNVLKVWPREFNGAPAEGRIGHARKTWDVQNGLRVNRAGSLVPLSMKDRIPVFDAAFAKATVDRPCAIAVNYEAAAREPLRSWLLNHQWDVIALDESHRIKSPGGAQSMTFDTLRSRGRKRLCMTGTAMPHSPLDVYAQYRFLDPGVYGSSYARFRQRYAVMGGFQGRQVLGMNEQLQPELEEKFARLAYIIDSEDLDKVLGLLDPVWPDTVEVDLGPKARRAYDGLENDMVASIEEGTLRADNALAQLVRLQQITSGYLPLDVPCPHCDGEGCDPCSGAGFRGELVEVGSEKLDAFDDWLADLPPDEAVAVCCRFTRDLDGIRRVAEKHGRRYMELSGRDNDGLTADGLMHADASVLGVQIQAGGVGVDLSRCRYVANYSVDFSLGNWLQWLKRTHRPGQTRRVVYQNFAVRNSIDGVIFKALAAREISVKSVIDGAKQSGRLSA